MPGDLSVEIAGNQGVIDLPCGNLRRAIGESSQPEGVESIKDLKNRNPQRSTVTRRLSRLRSY
jgi:hypothetical protein